MSCSYSNPLAQIYQKQLLKIVSRKVEISEEPAKEVVNEKDDPFKDLSTNELKDTVNELRERFSEEIPAELNAAVLLDNDAELSMSGSKLSHADILANIRHESVDEEQTDALEVEDESPVCPTSLK